MLSQLSGADLERLLDSIAAPTFIVGVEEGNRFAVIYANEAFRSATGLPDVRIGEQLPMEILPLEQAEVFHHHYCRCSETGEPVVFETQLSLPVGKRWLRITLKPVRDHGDAVVRLLGTMIDETEELQTRERLAYQHLLMRAQQDMSPDGIMIEDDKGDVINWNAKFCELWGVTEDMVRQGRKVLLPHLLTRLVEPRSFVATLDVAYRNLHADIAGKELELKDGKVYQLFSHGLVDEQNLGRGRIWFVHDVTESRSFQRRLSEALALQKAVLDSASQIILSVDSQGIIRSFNAAAEKLLGYRARDLIGKERALILLDPAELEERRAALAAELGGEVSVDDLLHGRAMEGEPYVEEWHYIRKDGSRFPVELSITQLTDDKGRHLGFLGIATDITERRATERRLFELATTDALTRLWNRRHFAEQAEKAMFRARRYDEHACIAMIDIDHFKRINDAYGHAAGDVVLHQVAQALNKMLRKSDFMCRWGGEEFSVFLVNTDPNEAMQVAERMRQTVMQLAVYHEGAEIPVTISTGLSDCLSCDLSLDVILSRADKALYAAKTAGRNRVEALWSDTAPAHEARSQG